MVVMHFILIWILLKISLFILGHGSQVTDIEWAMLVNAHINGKLLTIPLFLQRLTTMWTLNVDT